MPKQPTEGRMPTISRRWVLAGLATSPVLLAGCGTKAAALAKAAVSAPEPVLICWNHTLIPDIVTALGASGTDVPDAWPDRFDLVWVFTHAHGKWTFRQVHQHLLPGDA